MGCQVHLLHEDAAFHATMSRMTAATDLQLTIYRSGLELIDGIRSSQSPGCVLLDIDFPEMRGIEVQETIISLGLTIPIIFVTDYYDIPTAVRAIKTGAHDYLTKPVSRDVLLGAIEKATASASSVTNAEGGRQALIARRNRLTGRERQVFERVAEGRMNKQIAHELAITERTVKAHRRSVMEKMGFRSISDLVLAANELKSIRAAQRLA